jgi:hypothetical protein
MEFMTWSLGRGGLWDFGMTSISNARRMLL